MAQSVAKQTEVNDWNVFGVFRRFYMPDNEIGNGRFHQLYH